MSYKAVVLLPSCSILAKLDVIACLAVVFCASELIHIAPSEPTTGRTALDHSSAADCCGTNNGTVPSSAASLASASLYVDYIYLDTDERRRFAQVSHEYLIEQLQFTGDESTVNTNVKVKLNFNHPCKELIWVVQRDDVVKLNWNQWNNYTDQFDLDAASIDRSPWRRGGGSHQGSARSVRGDSRGAGG